MAHLAKTKLSIDLYKKLYLIRSAERLIRLHYKEDEMKTPMHMSAGGEQISVGVCAALAGRVQVFSSYRSHAVYLTLANETDQFFAELYGKATGMAKGKGGSMHLSAPEKGYYGAFAIVPGHIPLAVGAAFANVYQKNKKIAVAFFGDGAVDEGVFWESLNLACSKKLPVIFVCEDNGLAVHIPKHQRHGYKSITDVVAQFDCNVVTEESTDVEKIYQATLKAEQLIRKNGRPVFMHIPYYRYLQHVGVNEDFEAGYRSKNEMTKWLKVDTLDLQRVKLLRAKVSEKELATLEKKIDAQVLASKEKAQKAPFPETAELYRDVFAN